MNEELSKACASIADTPQLELTFDVNRISGMPDGTSANILSRLLGVPLSFLTAVAGVSCKKAALANICTAVTRPGLSVVYAVRGGTLHVQFLVAGEYEHLRIDAPEDPILGMGVSGLTAWVVTTQGVYKHQLNDFEPPQVFTYPITGITGMAVSGTGIIIDVLLPDGVERSMHLRVEADSE